MTNCPKFAKMQKMFQVKNASSSKGKIIVEVKTIIANVNVVDVNLTTRSRITKDQMFQGITKYYKLGGGGKLKKTMVEKI